MGTVLVFHFGEVTHGDGSRVSFGEVDTWVVRAANNWKLYMIEGTMSDIILIVPFSISM